MEKIRDLLEQLGSKELADKIIEALDNHKAKTKESIEEEYKQRLEKAKAVCLEEVESYKRELAHKTQIFFESRVEKIEQQIAKQVAVKDSAAEYKLHAIAGLLEGVDVNSESTNADIEAAKKQIKQLQEQMGKHKTTIKVLTEKANRSHAIAEKTLERNKVLSKELLEASKSGTHIKENKESTDNKTKAKAKVKAITESRKKASPVTTRKSGEHQITKADPDKRSDIRTLDNFSPEAIAAGIDD